MKKRIQSNVHCMPNVQRFPGTHLGRAHQRGTIMLLVVISMLLLSILGVAFLQVSRSDRSAVSATQSSNIKIVAQGVVAYIGDVLKRDLVNDATPTVMFDGTTDEPYDYPWTDPTADPDGDTILGYKVIDQDGSVLANQAQGGMLDDTWLASTEPDFSANPLWKHITNLNGIFLRIPKNGSSLTRPQEEATNTVDVAGQWQNDSLIEISGSNDVRVMSYDPSDGYEPIGADADGDDILDSKWTWAPIRQIGGVSYVMAVRIVDNSAMVNANVAMGQVTATADTFDTYYDAPRWLFPSELDFSNFYYKTATPTGSELLNSFTYRFANTSPGDNRISWITDTLSRYNYWHQAARRWDNYMSGYNKWTIKDELELRYRNGLNNPDVVTPIEDATTGLPNFLRKDNLSELTSTSVNSNKQGYFEDEPRHQMTTHNGASIYAMRLEDTTTDIMFNTLLTPAEYNDGNFLLKQDINSYIPLSSDTSTAKLAKKDALALEVFKVLSRNLLSSPFEGMTTAQVTDYTNQFIANFVDHVDSDNWMSTYQTRNGIELWPAITEVYTQRPVSVTSMTDPGATRVTTATGTPTGTTGYAIELINPHTQPIPISDIFIDMTYKDTSDVTHSVQFRPSGSAVSTLSQIISTAMKNANHGDEWLYPGQKVILYHDSTGGSTSSKTSTLIRDRDSVLGYIFNKIEGSTMDKRYEKWLAGQHYTVGQLVYFDDLNSSTYLVYECIQEHTSDNSTNYPDDSTTYLTNHDYWRKKIVVVDAGNWQVPDSFKTSELISVNLYPATQATGEGGSPASATFPYQTVSFKAWLPAQSISKDVFYDSYASWALNSDYVIDNEVRSTTNYMIYRCTTDDPTSPTDPASNANWTLASDENMFYVQATTIGSTDGLEAFAFKDGDMERRATTDSSLSTIAPHSAYFAQIGKPDKSTGPALWVINHNYSVNDLVTSGSQSYACVIAHSTLGKTSISDDIEKWVYIPTAGEADPASGIRGSSDQFLHTNMRAPHLYWQKDRRYYVGDVVRRQNDDMTFICMTEHVAASGNIPPSSNWAQHWRSMTDGYPIANIAELLQIVVAGPSSGRTLSDILGDAGWILPTEHLDKLMLPIDTSYVAGDNNAAIPHALALLDRLTIHSPNTDLLDNDGDGVVDNSEELLVPGTININTAPTHLLEKILPIPSTTSRASIVNAIKAYRDDGSYRKTNWRNTPGFANTSELYQALIGGSATVLDGGGDTWDINGTYVDFENKDQGTPDGIIDDREEKLMFARHLQGVTSARSDVYTAYILIRGYNTEHFEQGVVETKRLIAVIDRSNIADGSSNPKVIAVYEYD
jgi:hypothetical protein